MRRLLFILMIICVSSYHSFSQAGIYIKPSALGIHFFYDDFAGAAYVRSNSLGKALHDNKLFDFKNMTPGLALNYLHGLSNHIDLSISLGGAFLNYPLPGRAPFNDNKLLLESDVSVNAKLLSDRDFFAPYLSAGIGMSKYDSYYGAFIPLGGGLQLHILDDAYLFINSQWRMAISENTNYHFYYSIGFAGTIGKRKAPKPPALPPAVPIVEIPKDRDGDGIPDKLDSCPDIAGLLKFNGCPDTDNDGIPDKQDKCPLVPGLARYQGCPIPDTDGDGVNDEEDKCPLTPGLARYQGCPIPDRDHDGLNDEEDKCPDLPGEASNGGCPLIKQEMEKKIAYAAQHIFFNTGKYSLLATSYAPLNEVLAILHENIQLKLDIDGYTDNAGAAAANLQLSQQRADAVKQYLVTHGIDAVRLMATGHGQDSPVKSNKTAAGRSVNRRVELHVKY